MFGIDFCDAEMKSRYYLNFLEDILTICSYSGSYRIKKQKKIRKRRRVSLARGQKKFLKITGWKTYWKFLFFFIFYAYRGGWNVREKRWGKQSYLATSREGIREANAIVVYCFTD